MPKKSYSWYLDVSPMQAFSTPDYPLPGKRGIALCQEHSGALLRAEMIIPDPQAPECHGCWICDKPVLAAPGV